MNSPVLSSLLTDENLGPGAPIVAVLTGHLTRESLERTLNGVAEELGQRGRAPVIIDARSMPSYDLDARHAFVEWNKQWKDHLHRVAIVTESRLHMLVIATMAMAVRRPMKGFSEFADADAWARTP